MDGKEISVELPVVYNVIPDNQHSLRGIITQMFLLFLFL